MKWVLAIAALITFPWIFHHEFRTPCPPLAMSVLKAVVFVVWLVLVCRTLKNKLNDT